VSEFCVVEHCRAGLMRWSQKHTALWVVGNRQQATLFKDKVEARKAIRSAVRFFRSVDGVTVEDEYRIVPVRRAVVSTRVRQ
jgi:hypothetical protein